MESKVSSEQLKNEKDSSGKTYNLEKMGVIGAKHVEVSKAADERATLGPITPVPDRENGEVLIDMASPLSWISSPASVVCFDSQGNGADFSPRTSKKDVFDPFAPGPDELMLAPRRKKYLEGFQNNTARRLTFDSTIECLGDCEHGDGVKALSQEEMFLETVYETFLEAIVAKQAEGILAEPLLPKTPTSFPLSNCIAESCPGAPMKLKPARKLRNIDQGLCRKLEF
ncbi:hypothetical protein HHK36_033363 [Tetracentron sinense]|uniref:Uncharacterized protein n=1 Tax=Tetracentron sinense TaxID=13715 RepID=A0A835CWV9_TETSI|nr:hypothetical protein HHK36_033363 [Tetracentron sinense]